MGFKKHSDRKKAVEYFKKTLFISSNLGTKRKVSEEALDLARQRCPEQHWPLLVNISLADHVGHSLSPTERRLCAFWREIEDTIRMKMAETRPVFLYSDHVEVTYDIWFTCRCCKQEFNRVGLEVPRRRAGGKICKWCYENCKSFSDKKYTGCDSCTSYEPEGDEMSTFNYDRNPTPEARNLISKMRDTFEKGQSITVSEIENIAPAGCFTPSQQNLSKSILNQLQRFDVVEKSGDGYIYIGSI